MGHTAVSVLSTIAIGGFRRVLRYRHYLMQYAINFSAKLCHMLDKNLANYLMNIIKYSPVQIVKYVCKHICVNFDVAIYYFEASFVSPCDLSFVISYNHILHPVSCL